MIDDIKGHVLIVMAPMGGGKGTLIGSALRKFSDIYLTVSCTTRAPRPGEIDGKDYYFLTSEEFENKVQADEFLEWATFGKNRYGTLKSEIVERLQKGQMVIAEIDLQGVEQLQKIIPKDHITIVYIEAGGWENLKKRALERAPMSDEELSDRYERYLIESASKSVADLVIDNSSNDPEPAKQTFNELVYDLKTRVYKD